MKRPYLSRKLRYTLDFFLDPLILIFVYVLHDGRATLLLHISRPEVVVVARIFAVIFAIYNTHFSKVKTYGHMLGTYSEFHDPSMSSGWTR